MPKEITIYQCDICRQRYDQYFEASSCENQGLPKGELQTKMSEFKIGDTISFEEEDGGFSSLWSYSQNTGKLLAKQIISNNSEHVWMLIVEAKFGERGIIEVNQKFSGVSLMSPAELCYKPGFAQFLIDSKRAYEE